MGSSSSAAPQGEYDRECKDIADDLYKYAVTLLITNVVAHISTTSSQALLPSQDQEDRAIRRARSVPPQALRDWRSIPNGDSLLHGAFQHSRLKFADWWVGAQVSDLDIKNYKGDTVLHMAVVTYSLTGLKNGLVDHILTHKFPPSVDIPGGNGNSALLDAVEVQSISLVQLLATHKFSVNFVNTITGGSPLHAAVLRGYNAMARALLDLGAGVDPTNHSTGRTPLHIAASHGFLQTVKTLVEAGANLGALDSEGLTPIHHAVFAITRGSRDTPYGSDPKDPKGVLRLLLELGADPNSISQPDLDTPLLTAAKAGSWEIVSLLLEKKALPYLNGTKKSVLHVAIAEWARPIVVEKLLLHKADINVSDEKGRTPLMIAAKQEDERLFALLFKSGADLEAIDSEGNGWKTFASESFVRVMQAQIDGGLV